MKHQSSITSQQSFHYNILETSKSEKQNNIIFTQNAIALKKNKIKQNPKALQSENFCLQYFKFMG